MTHSRQNGASDSPGRGMAGGRALPGPCASPPQPAEAVLNPPEAAWSRERLVIVEVPPLLPPADMLSVRTLEVLCATAFTPVCIKRGTGVERCVRRIRRTVQEDYEVLRRDLARALESAGG
jgi:hypothetical protein